MDNKFKPFDPKTAKNGDVVYMSCNTNKAYQYIGPDVAHSSASVIYHNGDYFWDYDMNLVAVVPKKTVWVNVYAYPFVDPAVYGYTTKEQAEYASDPNKHFKGTFPIEIDAE